MYWVVHLSVFFCIFCSAFCEELKCLITHSPDFILDCSRLNISQIPSYIDTIKDQVIAKRLILSNNKFNSSANFNGWSSLVYLDVSNNNINNITDHTFGSLSHLKLLNISNNNISEITWSAFDQLTVLEILDLSGNPSLGSKIHMLNNTLAGLFFKTLKMFTMRSSALQHIPINMFENAPELQYLDLSDNNIKVIPNLPPSLVYFNANNNSIETIDISSFQKSKFLKDLYIEDNVNLTKINMVAFETMHSLRNLSLKGCKNLRSLPKNMLYWNRKLKHLSLADCGLTTVPHAFKSTFLNVTNLELQDNPWICNISIKWFIVLEESKTENLWCAQPMNISFSEYYGPKYRHKVLGKILVGLLALVFILFGIAIYLSYSMGKRKMKETPYRPLDEKNSLPSAVYVTTVV